MTQTNSSIRRRVLLGSAILGLALALGAGFLGCGRPPQLGASENVFRTVDALFTAVTARDEQRLAQCARRLLTHRDAGELPPEAFAYLDRIIRQAQSARWESAARELYDFMKVQRRDGIDRRTVVSKRVRR